jgi:hypothetical protein
LLSITRLLGITALCLSFFYLRRWTFFFCILAGLTLPLLVIFFKYSLETPHWELTSTGNIDSAKYVLNKIAITNGEDLITDKIAFSLNPAQALKRRELKFMLTNLFDSREKFIVVGVFSLCWLSYTVSQILHFVFIEQLQSDLYLNLAILASTELLATLSTKVILKLFLRRNALLLLYLILALCFIFLILF